MMDAGYIFIAALMLFFMPGILVLAALYSCVQGIKMVIEIIKEGNDAN